jgi:hypothetical protein
MIVNSTAPTMVVPVTATKAVTALANRGHFHDKNHNVVFKQQILATIAEMHLWLFAVWGIIYT